MTDSALYVSLIFVLVMLCLGLCYHGSKGEKALVAVAVTVAAILIRLSITSSNHVA